MKKSRSFLAVLIVSLLFVLLSDTAKADLWDVPVGPGESFRWVFVTSLTTYAYSPFIANYNSLVQDSASIATQISGVLGKENIAQIEWRAIASTIYTDAIDNIIGDPTAPIYTPQGDLVAFDKADMFDGVLMHPIDVTENGGTPTASETWTGSNADGRGDDLASLGGRYAVAVVGYWYVYDDPACAWINGHKLSPYLYRHLYAISEELTVVPVPSAVILGATGMLSATLGLKRLRRKHQE